MAVGDVATMRIHYIQNSQHLYNMLQFLQTDSGATFTSLAQRFTSTGSPTVLADFRACLPTNCLIADLFMSWKRAAVNDELTYPINLAGTSFTSSHNNAPQLAFLVKWTTGFAGRRWRGRTYFPGPGSTSGLDSAGRWPSAAQVAYAAFLANFATQFVAGTPPWQFVIYSPKQNEETPGYIPAPVLAGAATQLPATQRRRSVLAGN